MPTIGLRTHKLSIERLKGIRGLDEISFEDKALTGIFGPNGIGKSTILQALAGAYASPANCWAVAFRQIFPRLGDNRAVQLTRVISLAAKHPDWSGYTQRVREWLQERKVALNLP